MNATLSKSQPKTPPKLSGNAVQAFLLILKDGINSWQTAGALLVEMRKDNPSVYAEIIRREPLITVDMLETIERLGRKELHPQLLLNSQLPVKRLIGFPYEVQARLCSEPIDVVVKVVSGKPTVHKKLIRDMSRRELGIALDTKRVRSVQEQTNLCIRSHNEGNEAWRALKTPAKSPMSISSSSFVAAKMDTPAISSPIKPEDLICFGRWVVRQTIGNNCSFERTNATGLNPVRIILDDGIAVIEVVKMKN
jgi:hypothetical protein